MKPMLARLEQLRGEALAAIAGAADVGALEALRVNYLGRKGALKALMGELSKLPAGEKPAAGQLALEPLFLHPKLAQKSFHLVFTV